MSKFVGLTEREDKLLSLYIDLAHAKGADSFEARQFRDAYARNPKLARLMAIADTVRRQLASGELKCDDEGNIIS